MTITPSGISAQAGWGREPSYGTRVGANRFLPFRSENIETSFGRVEADDILAGAQTARQDQQRSGNISVGGTVNYYLFNRNIGSLFEAVLGAVATSGAGPYTHVCTPDGLAGLSDTVQIGKSDNAGNMRVFTHSGMKAKSLKLAVTAGEFVTMSVDWVGQDTSTTSGLATAVTPAGMVRYHADDMTTTLGGASVCVRNLGITFANALDVSRRCAGSNLVKEPIRNGHLEVSGSMEVEWVDLAQYDRVRDLVHAPLVIEFANGADSLTLESTVKLDSTSQPVSGRGAVYQTLGFTGAGAATDAETITATIINSDATA